MGVPLPAQSECLGGGCYDGLAQFLMLAAVGALAVVALVIFVMVKLGIGWLIKWILAAGLLAAMIPPIVVNALHTRKQSAFEKLDQVGPLPRLADRTPLVIMGGYLPSCPPVLVRYVEANLGAGVLALTMPLVDDVDFAKPVRLAELPLAMHTRALSTVVDSYFVEGKEVTFAEDRMVDKVTPLSADARAAAAASIDYVIIAQCEVYGGGIFDSFRQNPSLQTDAEHFAIDLAMAPIEKGSGMLSVRELKFDLIDLWYAGVTPGFLFAGSRVGGENRVPYDPELVQQSFCLQKDGTMTPDCGE